MLSSAENEIKADGASESLVWLRQLVAGKCTDSKKNYEGGSLKLTRITA